MQARRTVHTELYRTFPLLEAFNYENWTIISNFEFYNLVPTFYYINYKLLTSFL